MANAIGGELYSESNYVPQYGTLTESQIRWTFRQQTKVIPYIGAATQVQNKTSDSQEDLYEKNGVMAVAGVRAQITPLLSTLAEYRTEERSRLGLYSGNLWQYHFSSQLMFTEYYAESFILPHFDWDPISTVWIKQGLRFSPVTHFFVDPFLEGYIRNSPTPELGRTTQQFRTGVRALYQFKLWSISLLAFESFPNGEKPHEEALLVLGGSF